MDPLIEIEQQIRQLLPVVLVGPALVLTAAGLIIWLAGIRLLKFIAALTAAAAGFACAWHFTDRQFVPLLLCAIIPVAISFFLYKPIVVLLAGVLTFTLVLFVPAGITSLQNANTHDQQASIPQEATLDLMQSIQQAEESLSAAKQRLIDYVASVPSGRKAIAYMAAVGVIGVGLFSWRLVCGAACSILGIILLSCGMLLLLFYKGAQPLIVLEQNIGLIACVLIAIGMVGTIVQYWISPKKQNKKQDLSKVLAEGDAK